ncbi:MAG: hypothetical protein QHC78_16805 [Pigmentiphaga sp.]|uniref:hypothetical protein n=1 Tax=Pigmentiphaga sp. TaxID=1977564 RepID=UPI0029BE5916|nr:hypothetical protein [Pigmentiphaga sp.]MDX3907352.1 hypothetical protein [Pigmentiphaga sp.]
MRKLAWAAGGCLAVTLQAHAQLAAPQTRGAWADSTLITGVAEKVMPDAPPIPSAPVDPRPITPMPPLTVQELLNRMNGAELYFRQLRDRRSGWDELPGTLRVVVRNSGAEIQAHNAGKNNWYRLCTLAPTTTECVVSAGSSVGANLVIDITSSAISVSDAYCQAGFSGTVEAHATFTWENYSMGHGAFSNQNWRLQVVDNGYSGYFFQNGRFSSSCYYEMPG